MLTLPAMGVGRLELPTSRLSDISRALVGAGERWNQRVFTESALVGASQRCPALIQVLLQLSPQGPLAAPHVIDASCPPCPTPSPASTQPRLDWIIVRPGAFTDGNRTGEYRHGFPGTDQTTKLKISRAHVADFMSKQLTDDTYLHKTPGLSY